MLVNTMILILTLEGILFGFQVVQTGSWSVIFVLTSVHQSIFLLKFYMNFVSHHSILVQCVVFSLMLGAVALKQWLPTLAFSPSNSNPIFTCTKLHNNSTLDCKDQRWKPHDCL